MRLLVFFLLIFVFLACDSQDTTLSSKEEATVLLKEIKKQEEEINTLSKDLRPGMKVPQELYDELIQKLSSFYQRFPENESAPVCLDKLHMIYSAKREYQTSADFGDTLLKKYPNYINRPMIIESMATTYDIFIQPRDTVKVRYYNELLLEEDKEMPQEKREEIIFKLEHLDLSWEEMILEMNKK